jgi:hypothetical protein
VYRTATSDYVPNDKETRTLAAVRAEGLTKGFGHYSDSDVNTYYSGNEIDFLGVYCQYGRLHFYHWLTDDAILDKPAQRTFLLYDPSRFDAPGCPVDAELRQFGQPGKRIPLTYGRELLVYDRDITPDLR